MVEQFPHIEKQLIRKGGEDRNPAVQLFGRRFFADQTVPELLVELLLVVSSRKSVGDKLIPEEKCLPDMELLRKWPDKEPLRYAAKARLNLKLFAFLGASKLETRHETHREHYRRLLRELEDPEKLIISGSTDKTEAMRTIENLFLGFQGVGGQRTWCACAFVPFSRNVISAETLWNDTQANRDNVRDWDIVSSRFLHYFSLNRHRFLARGGELLYLQICNALRQDFKHLEEWCRKTGLGFSSSEVIPEQLHEALERAFGSVLDACPEAVGKLADFIDSGVDAETAQQTDFDTDGNPRFTSCGWCPRESWPEGLMFAVELLRLCEAGIDPIERLELMQTACAMQVLRSLCAQSARHVDWAQERTESVSPLAFIWAVSDPEGQHTVIKQISRRSVNAILRMIHDAVRHPDILAILEKQRRADKASGHAWRDPYREADGRYGYKLFLTMAKRIGLIIPKRGAGARFVLNERLLRCIVLSVIRPGERVTYETFKNLIFAHFGLAVDDKRIGQACEWNGTQRLSTLGGDTDSWLVDMLDAAGMLVRLSDSCSLVMNPFGGKGKKL